MDIAEIQKEIEEEKAEIKARQERIVALEQAIALLTEHMAKKHRAATIDAMAAEIARTPIDSDFDFIPPAPPSPTNSNQASSEGKAATIRQYIPSETAFNVNDVYAAMTADGVEWIDKNDVSFLLSRMQRKGKLVVVTQGSGKRPSEYKFPS